MGPLSFKKEIHSAIDFSLQRKLNTLYSNIIVYEFLTFLRILVDLFDAASITLSFILIQDVLWPQYNILHPLTSCQLWWRQNPYCDVAIVIVTLHILIMTKIFMGYPLDCYHRNYSAISGSGQSHVCWLLTKWQKMASQYIN